jgi:translocation and assembly module TamA
MRRLVLLAGVALALQGCGTLRGGRGADAQSGTGSDAPVSFKVDVVSDNRRIASHLERYLDIQRFASFPDLQAGELRRLLAAAEDNARDLLAAQGYFEPRLELRMGEPSGKDATRHIVIDVDPGRQATVSGYDIQFAEPMNSAAEAERQRRAIQRDWSLREGDAFTQDDWDVAKSEGLRTLQRQRYPAARIAASSATIDADAARADLRITYDAGPLYRFGQLELTGVQRYDAAGIRNIAGLPLGKEYSEETLLDAQQRLVSSGYFDSAFLVLDTNSSQPEQATVTAQLREAKYQKVVFGLGYSTDAGPRVSIDHTHNRMWPFHWRAVNHLEVGTNTQLLSTQMTDMPNAGGWAWYTGTRLERSEYGDFKANSVSLTGGRTRATGRTDRRYYVQYDAAKAEGGDAPGGSSSILANYAWTGRYFNDRNNPTRGHGYGVEAGIGFTLTPERDPFARALLRAMQFWPFGGRNAAGRRSRLALRSELGAVYAKDDVRIPVPLLFLTGGDTTVRGYGYQSIGERLADGSIYGARYLAMGSVEWQRPITLFGDGGSFEHAIFVDAGSAADSIRDARLYTGVGTGLRWNSPVGPLQVDMGYGIQERQWRLHLRMGFQF